MNLIKFFSSIDFKKSNLHFSIFDCDDDVLDGVAYKSSHMSIIEFNIFVKLLVERRIAVDEIAVDCVISTVERRAFKEELIIVE